MATETPIVTPNGGWPAQPALTPREAFLRIVRDDVTRLLDIAASLEQPKLLRSRTVRGEMQRTLSRVTADCETLRLALEKGRA